MKKSLAPYENETPTQECDSKLLTLGNLAIKHSHKRFSLENKKN